MKKIMFLMMGLISMSFVACGNKSNCTEECTEDSVTVENDTMFIADSISTDTIVVAEIPAE